MKKLSVNKKTNIVLNDIYEDLQELGIEEVKRYKKAFSRETDYNLVQYGNMRIYYDDIRELYKKANIKTMENASDDFLWCKYKEQVGYVARMMILGQI